MCRLICKLSVTFNYRLQITNYLSFKPCGQNRLLCYSIDTFVTKVFCLIKRIFRKSVTFFCYLRLI